ncbi:hypothetical protein [Micromonospora inyonensis]|uniref:Uncharacterized protein n=1 Tax=Micromonospora inyonensis TaxID=47866 RepID=A0A1C6SC36_9ACTN|nr:hypothetical protein [Micromonospora inyonensis]SCL26965.1 hypothetical protein GA0074694_4670 [Micromonospora inyonensis]
MPRDPLTLAGRAYQAAANLAELLSGDVRIADPGPLLAAMRATGIMLAGCCQELADAADGANQDEAAAELRAAMVQHAEAANAVARAVQAFRSAGVRGR